MKSEATRAMPGKVTITITSTRIVRLAGNGRRARAYAANVPRSSDKNVVALDTITLLMMFWPKLRLGSVKTLWKWLKSMWLGNQITGVAFISDAGFRAVIVCQ